MMAKLLLLQTWAPDENESRAAGSTIYYMDIKKNSTQSTIHNDNEIESAKVYCTAAFLIPWSAQCATHALLLPGSVQQVPPLHVS